ncbi:MAG TPA: thioredoxin domain-containing protein, partial [Polyangiaceae bacterium]|nr:thioredoxin domain-containing protein [Polyangiaceae bacterium]
MAAENRLARETSPYLLQHAHNPVDWYPWGPEALERARVEDRPILLSIGYAACHWCHVMERESFENPAIAAQMNENFVCIKVDREERPDLDDIYMSATVAMSGSGGWPMTVILTPEQEPFFAGTYFPPVDRFGRSGFGTLLTKLSELWRNERDAVFEQAKQLTAHVRQQSGPAASPGDLSLDSQRSAIAQLAQSYDSRYGGFGKAP